MANKYEITFRKLQNGRLVKKVQKATFLNDPADGLSKAKMYATREFPEAGDVTVIRNDRHPEAGLWDILVKSNIEKGTYFQLIITKL